jgi:uncharacterized protein YbjT (DUF2867 family)
MRILVTGGTGMVGSQVVRELLARKQDVAVLTRNAAKASALPDGVTAITGNLLEPSTVSTIFKGFDAVFLVNTVSPTEADEGLMAVSGMRLAGVKRVVYLSVHHVDDAPWLPHFGAKVGVEAAVRRSGIPYTILRPNNFYQNDYWAKDAILQYGVYPQPIGEVGLSRVDVRDIAEAAANALVTSGHDGQVYDIVGPELLTGASTARIWSEALGRPVAYAGNDLDAWQKQSLQYLPDWLVFDFKLMYDFFQKEGFKASAESIERQHRLLGRPPRTFQAFVKETAAAWTAVKA